ncbi:hypothetical protein F5B18DRAFT_268502 [Nemania serpens]|nr:hypothetical protein F5B18DRAFT_268502 [Nemania serpens]
MVKPIHPTRSMNYLNCVDINAQHNRTYATYTTTSPRLRATPRSCCPPRRFFPIAGSPFFVSLPLSSFLFTLLSSCLLTGTTTTRLPARPLRVRLRLLLYRHPDSPTVLQPESRVCPLAVDEPAASSSTSAAALACFFLNRRPLDSLPRCPLRQPLMH